VPGWTIVIPLKPPGVGKTRLGSDAELARAIALDTVEAAGAATSVSRVIVITADAALADELDEVAGVEVVAETRPAGIASAIARGLAHAGTEGDDNVPHAALLGDLPGLVAAELDDVLAQAQRYDRAFVADADGSGTTLVTARGGLPLEERFGPGSAAAHLAAGLAQLDVPPASSVRWDVDDPRQLADLAARGIGPRTRAVLAARSAQL
jgi:2-phospho-L-lactate guanylyltransferase